MKTDKLFTEKDIIATLWKCGCPTTPIIEFKNFGKRLLSDKQFREMYYSSKEEERKSYKKNLDTKKRFTMKDIYDTIAIAHWGHGTGIDWHIRFVRGLRKGKHILWDGKDAKEINTNFDNGCNYVMWVLGEKLLIEFHYEDDRYTIPIPKTRKLRTLPK